MFYFENRNLKQEIMRLDNRLEIRRKEFDDCDMKRKNHAAKLIEHEDTINDLTLKIKQAENKTSKANKIIREQTGADLLVNALKELGVIPLSEKEPDHFKEATILQNQMAAAQQAQYPSGRQTRLGQQQSRGFGSPYLGGFIS